MTLDIGETVLKELEKTECCPLKPEFPNEHSGIKQVYCKWCNMVYPIEWR